MENICDNARPKNMKINGTQFAKAKRTRGARKSLLTSLFHQDDNCSVTSSCTAASTDSEWNNLQNKFAAVQEIEGHFEDDLNSLDGNDSDEDESPIIRGLTGKPKGCPRPSLGTIAAKREELELVKQSMEYDDELQYLNAFIDSMEENFKTMFGEVTVKRCISEFEEKNHRKPASINYYDIIDNMCLHMYPVNQWAIRIEEEIKKYLV